MHRPTIPPQLIAIVAEVLGRYYYNHTSLNALFIGCGAPPDVPPGNCVQKCLTWLKQANEDPKLSPLELLGCVLQKFMDSNTSPYSNGKDDRDRIEKALAKNGLSYHPGGRIIGGQASAPSRSLEGIIREHDLPALNVEFERALSNIQSDPPAAVTAACAIIEAFCKVYIEEKGLQLPAEQTVKRLWAIVQGDLGLDPSSIADQDIKRILGGLASIVDGAGALRTHVGSAHGHGGPGSTVSPVHARLAVHAAHTLVVFVMETWQAS